MGMCGPSSAMTGAQAQEASFSRMLQNNYSENFGKNSAILGHLTSILTPIAEAGPDQQGFGANELAALNTGAREGVGRNFAHAEQALNTTIGSRGGGNEVLPSGANDQLRAELATSGARESSRETQDITEKNYGTGRDIWGKAVSGLDAVAAGYNPNAIAGETNTANQASYSEAEKNNEASQAWEGQVMGLVGGLGGAALGNPALFGGKKGD